MKPEPLLACWGAAPAAFTPPPLLDEWFLLCFQLSCPIDGRFGVSPHEGILLAGRAQIACEARRLYCSSFMLLAIIIRSAPARTAFRQASPVDISFCTPCICRSSVRM